MDEWTIMQYKQVFVTCIALFVVSFISGKWIK